MTLSSTLDKARVCVGRRMYRERRRLPLISEGLVCNSDGAVGCHGRDEPLVSDAAWL